jgi:esterase/lipase
MLFHGFNDRPQQQAKLASYLFHNGFNVYNVFLADMYVVKMNSDGSGGDATGTWAKTVYRPEVLQLVQSKLQDPANQPKLQPILPRLQAGTFTPDDIATIDAILGPDLSVEKLKGAWQDPGSDAWNQLFLAHDATAGESLLESARHSDFADYVKDATARLADLAPMPGPIFIGGLSVGGAMALALGEADGGRRVRSIVAHAPWLDSFQPQTNLQIMMAGPLDDKVGAAGGQYPITWPNHRIDMSPASIAANLALGAWTAKPERVATLATIPTATITTEADDSADNAATATLNAAMTSNAAVAPLHVAASYPKALNIGHAMTDPENYPDNNPISYNRFFRTLYQESYRFYLTGGIDQNNLVSTSQDPSLPQVSCVTPDFPARCAQ